MSPRDWPHVLNIAVAGGCYVPESSAFSFAWIRPVQVTGDQRHANTISRIQTLGSIGWFPEASLPSVRNHIDAFGRGLFHKNWKNVRFLGSSSFWLTVSVLVTMNLPFEPARGNGQDEMDARGLYSGVSHKSLPISLGLRIGALQNQIVATPPPARQSWAALHIPLLDRSTGSSWSKFSSRRYPTSYPPSCSPISGSSNSRRGSSQCVRRSLRLPRGRWLSFLLARS